MVMFNPELMRLAEWRINELTKSASLEKEAVLPAGAMDPSAGGGGGTDPSSAGGPPMDPSAAGGAPPMDPSAGGGMPAPPPTDPTAAAGAGGLTADSIRQIVQQVMQSMGGAGGPGGKGPGVAKPDINTVAMDIFQVKKLLTGLYNTMGIPLPPDILDGPNRDPSSGAPMPPGAPGSTSDPNQQAAQSQQQQPQSAIPPIQAMQAATPQAPGGAEKQSQEDPSLQIGLPMPKLAGFDASVISKAAALSRLCRKIRIGS